MLSMVEIWRIAVITAALGFIFKGFIGKYARLRHAHYDPLVHHPKGFDWEGFKFSIMVTAPAIILHELGHKFVAMALGLKATLYAAYGWLGFGILLRLMNFGFIFFVPGYVAHSPAPPLQSAAISFAGPAMNLLIWGICAALLKYGKVQRKYVPLLTLSKNINLFLFAFNMIPIRPFDGGGVVNGLLRYFSG
ncbi:metalloprotease [Nanoarchaeota archaeon]